MKNANQSDAKENVVFLLKYIDAGFFLVYSCDIFTTTRTQTHVGGRDYEKEFNRNVSTVLFDDVQEVLHDRVSLDKMKPVTDKEYYVRGCTALLDAIEVDGRFGIGADRAVNYECDAVGTAVNYKVLSKAVSQVRASAVCPSMALSEDWKEEIEADYKMRHRR